MFLIVYSPCFDNCPLQLFCALELMVIRINLSDYYAPDMFYRIDIGTAGWLWQDAYLWALQPLIRCTAHMNGDGDGIERVQDDAPRRSGNPWNPYCNSR
ncbi:unnamed protein product [Haemonchus placei]|uniref:G_PROTEIN_RECEP_F1_2 domain-containing protein n=1 Tax=Haemonchus placei TaxID=6290 RepID=A0A0N4WQ95_HAEPC|nr:unnamed protein product [Haemonchus placei]